MVILKRGPRPLTLRYLNNKKYIVICHALGSILYVNIDIDFFWGGIFFTPLFDRTAEYMKGESEGGMTCSKGPQVGVEPATAVLRNKPLYMPSMPALPTELCGHTILTFNNAPG